MEVAYGRRASALTIARTETGGVGVSQCLMRSIYEPKPRDKTSISMVDEPGPRERRRKSRVMKTIAKDEDGAIPEAGAPAQEPRGDTDA